MASGFLAILDDIAALMDDVAVMSKVAAKKTAGILGDDLAVNAEKASGFASSREIPVLWSITKGSTLNKIIILPVAFLLSSFFPIAITIALLVGGFYLAYEGAEKIYEYFVPHSENKKEEILAAETEEEILAIEKGRIKSAVLTDFILSVEIIIIAMSTVATQPLTTQILVVSAIALLATVGVYGIVALIIRMDEAGYYLIKRSGENSSLKKSVGNLLVNALPVVIKGLSFVGTIALILVAGGIFAHNVDFFHHFLPTWPSMLKEALIGIIIGIITLIVVKAVKYVISMIKKKN